MVTNGQWYEIFAHGNMDRLWVGVCFLEWTPLTSKRTLLAIRGIATPLLSLVRYGYMQMSQILHFQFNTYM